LLDHRRTLLLLLDRRGTLLLDLPAAASSATRGSQTTAATRSLRWALLTATTGAEPLAPVAARLQKVRHRDSGCVVRACARVDQRRHWILYGKKGG